ncbi:MAG: hypothetical protein AAGI44_16285 [Pseudomonadota bacterium]
MENGKDDKGTPTAPETVENDPHFQQTSRRRFGKHALGAAVLLSIANRGAWGSSNGYGGGKYDDDGKGKEYETKCISKATWASHRSGNSSHSPTDKATKEVEDFKRFLEKGDVKDTFVKRRGGYKEFCAKREKDGGNDNYGWGHGGGGHQGGSGNHNGGGGNGHSGGNNNGGSNSHGGNGNSGNNGGNHNNDWNWYSKNWWKNR